jgi:radical SAM superfamily enzyme YgiQ (UPF0313 family)
MPEMVYNFLKGEGQPDINGRAHSAPYAIRKLESALLEKYSPAQVVVPHDNYIEEFIGPDTEVIGISTMDPLGFGPLTMSYSLFFGGSPIAYVRKEFETLVARVNRARKGTKAKLAVGGPGVWEFTIAPEELDNLGFDYAFQGEADDIAIELFDQMAEGSLSNNMFFEGFQTFDDHFHRQWSNHEKFISRRQFSKQFPKLEEIPDIKNPAIKGLVEVMRGCGIGCDFCEVTLRPLRYYPPEKVRRELEVNVRGGYDGAWLHSDEIFAYRHGKRFVPNEEALLDLFNSVMVIPGIMHTNPTHGRISIPAAYPELIRKLSKVMRAGPANWIGLQVGVETGSDRLAKMHMPNKTLPLTIGVDDSWQNIVWKGTFVMNKYYWRPAFTVQVGQYGETPEDNWETVALINKMSNSEVDGRPFEFTITPMQNVPLGLIKSRALSPAMLDESQLAVYYASYRHLSKMASRNAFRDTSGKLLARIGTGLLISVGGIGMMQYVGAICKKRGVDLEKVSRYGLEPMPVPIIRSN